MDFWLWFCAMCACFVVDEVRVPCVTRPHLFIYPVHLCWCQNVTQLFGQLATQITATCRTGAFLMWLSLNLANREIKKESETVAQELIGHSRAAVGPRVAHSLLLWGKQMHLFHISWSKHADDRVIHALPLPTPSFLWQKPQLNSHDGPKMLRE